MSKHIRSILVGILCLLVAVLIAMTLSLREDVAQLQHAVEELSTDIDSQSAYLQNSISEMGNRLTQDLAEQGSLFSKVEAQLSYQKGELVLTASVLPKEVVAGTSYLLTLENTAQSVEMVSDGKTWSGTLKLSPSAEFTPVVVEQSSAGARQEALDTLYPDNILAIEGSSIWSWNLDEMGPTAEQQKAENVLYVTLVPNTDGPVRTAEDVSRLTLLVKDGNGATLEAMDMSAMDAPDGDTRLWYQADLSAYMEQESCSIHLYTTLETSSGLTLCDASNEAASYAKDGMGSSSGSGTISFSPQW